jgi:hypothetical protein
LDELGSLISKVYEHGRGGRQQIWGGSVLLPLFVAAQLQPPASSEQGAQYMTLRKKELEYLKNEMTWREFADGAGATVLMRGLARKSSKKIPTKAMKNLQRSIALTMADVGRKATIQDALKVISKALSKNGPHVADKLMAKDVKKAKVSKRLRKQVEVTMANREAA